MKSSQMSCSKEKVSSTFQRNTVLVEQCTEVIINKAVGSGGSRERTSERKSHEDHIPLNCEARG